MIDQEKILLLKSLEVCFDFVSVYNFDYLYWEILLILILQKNCNFDPKSYLCVTFFAYVFVSLLV